MLLWTGWHEPGALGSLDLYTVLQNVASGRPANAPITAGQQVSGKYQVIIGDWGHGGGLDLGIELQFYDTWIKGIDTGLPKDTDTPLHLAELGGTRRWINARCYPLVQRYTPFFLSGGRKLTQSSDGAASQDEFRWVPQAMAADSFEYASEPFVDGAMLAGPLAAQLQVTSSNTNLQLFVEVFDRAPADALSRIVFGSALGALRRTDPEKSWTDESGLPARPYLTLDEDVPMTPGEQTKLEVPLGPTVWSIEPGHSIVVRISTHPPDDQCLGVLVPPVGCYPTEPNLETLRGGVYSLHLGGEAGSLLSLPLLEHGAFPTIENAASPTGTAEYPLPIVW
jgi:predicted acyl esterase